MRRLAGFIFAVVLVVVSFGTVRAQVSTVGRAGGVDVNTGAAITVDYEHHEIHNGSAYRITAIVDNDSLVIAFKTPNTTSWMHAIIDWGSETSATFAVLEGATWNDSTGVQIPIFNRDRNSANSSGLLEDSKTVFAVTDSVSRNPTGLTGGTNIVPDEVWTVGKAGVTTRGESEFIAKQNTTYAILVLTSPAGGLKLKIRFYMHTNKH